MTGQSPRLIITARDLLRVLWRLGCVEIRQKGSHLIVRCGHCQTVVPVHQGEDIGPGLLRAIERQLEPCLGKRLVDAMKAKKRYVVDYERDERGLWVAAVRGVPGCHTQGRTIQQGQERIREALSLFIGDTAENVELVRRVKLAAGLQRRVQRATRAKERARQETANAQEALREAVRGLIDNGFSYADAGELLGVTRQWAHEILSTG